MIPNLLEIAERCGVNRALLLLVLAGLFTGLVLFVQSILRWFEDRNS